MSDILHETRGPVAWTVLNRPQARNALTFAMYEGLTEQARRVAADPAIRAWVITGAGGKAFAAGTDIGQFTSFRTGQDGLDYEAKLEVAPAAIEDCPKPVIAAVAGFCTGGGLAIAGACDLRIATEDARFGMPIARTLGNCLSMQNYARLVSLLGPARVKEVIFTARMVTGTEALATGLVSELLPDAAALEARAMELAETVAAMAPLTLAATKAALARLRRATTAEIEGDDLVAMCFGSEDFREGVSAFLAKRSPNWTGR